MAKTQRLKKQEVTRGSGNVFEDLGFGSESADLQAKAALTHQISSRIEELGLSQSEAGIRLGLAQPDVSKLKNGKFTGFSVDRLIALLNALDLDVEIVVKRKNRRSAGDGGSVLVRELATA